MIKLLTANSSSFHNFKCGEVFCLSMKKYDISCCLCGIKVDIIDFPMHFQNKHLSCNKSREKHVNDTNIQSGEYIQTFEADPIILNKVTFKVKPEEMNEQCSDLREDHSEEMLIHMNVAEEVPNVKNNCYPQQSNALLNLGELGARVNLHDGEEVNDDDIDIGVANNEWLHEKYSYDDVPNDDENLDDIKNYLESDDEDNLHDTDGAIQEKNITEQIDSFELQVDCMTCQHCDRVFNSSVGLKIHIKAMHKPEDNYSKSKSKAAKLFQCQNCGEKFLTERSLKNHRYKHTGIFCNVCGKQFSQVGNLERHQIRHGGIKSVECKECDKTFFTERELKAHMMRHTGILPIICEICGKRCRDHGVLTAHKRRHTGDRPAKCKVCGKSFFCGYDLNVHSVTHTTDRPFKCDICGSTFRLKKSLRVHMKIHSKDRNHKCKICGKCFTQSSGLNSHMRMHDTTKTKTINEDDFDNKLFKIEESSYHRNFVGSTDSSPIIVNNIEANIGTHWNLEII